MVTRASILDYTVIVGTEDSGTLNGTAGKDIIFGNGGTDTLNGLAGDDAIVIDVGSPDAANGGENGDLGDSLILFGDPGASVTFDLSAADQTPLPGVQEGFENLALAFIEGDDGHTVIGSDGDNEIIGSSGDDTITGGLGADRLGGLDGSDTFIYEAAADSTVPEAAAPDDGTTDDGTAGDGTAGGETPADGTAGDGTTGGETPTDGAAGEEAPSPAEAAAQQAEEPGMPITWDIIQVFQGGTDGDAIQIGSGDTGAPIDAASFTSIDVAAGEPGAPPATATLMEAFNALESLVTAGGGQELPADGVTVFNTTGFDNEALNASFAFIDLNDQAGWQRDQDLVLQLTNVEDSVSAENFLIGTPAESTPDMAA
jgi:hypothetical protein